MARAVRQTQRGTSVTFLQSSRWSLCRLSQSSISAYETNTPRWSHKFHPHLCTNWCLQIFVLSTHTSRLEHSTCWNPSQVLVVCNRVIWSGRLSHDTPAVKGDAHCWIFAEEPKNHLSQSASSLHSTYPNHWAVYNVSEMCGLDCSWGHSLTVC